MLPNSAFVCETQQLKQSGLSLQNVLLSVIRHVLAAVILTAERGIKSYRFWDSSLSITVLRTKLKSTQAPWR
jgi:hypothetical protein